MSITNLTRYGKYNNFSLNKRIAFFSRKTTKFSIDKSIASNLRYNFLDSNFVIEPISIEYSENNSYERRFTFSNELKFTIDERYDIFDILDKFNKNKYFIGIESYLDEWYIINCETESEFSYTFSLTSNGLICQFTFNTMQNLPCIKVDVLPTVKQIYLPRKCGYVSTEVISVKAIESNNIFIYKDSNGDYNFQLSASMKDIAFNRDSVEMTQSFSDKTYQNELKFTITNDEYNWRFNLLEFINNYYTFIITTNNNDNIILESLFPIFNQTNNQTEIVFKSVSSSQNLFLTENKINISHPDKWMVDYTEFIYEEEIFYAKEYKYIWNENTSQYDRTEEFRKGNVLNPTNRLEGISCKNFDLVGTYQYILYENLETNITFDEIITENSTSCGYVPPVNYGDLAFNFDSSSIIGGFKFRLNNTEFTATTSPYSTKISDLIGDDKLISLYEAFHNFYGKNVITKFIKFPNTSDVENMNGMFYDCNLITELDVSSFNTSKVTDMEVMFNGCSSLTSLDLSNFDTSNVSKMYGMFRMCKALTTINLTSFNTSNVINMGEMFSSCNSLKSLDLSNFETSKVTDMRGMFNNCYKLSNLDLSNFYVTNVIDIHQMFANCFELVELNLDNWILNENVNFQNLFIGDSKLKTIYLRNSDETTKNIIQQALIAAGLQSQVSLVTD